MNKAYTFYIVDDDEAVRASLGFALRVQGHAVEVFADAMTFLRRCADEKNAVLISDVGMPDMNGIELTRTLRGRGSNIPILLVTGHGDRQCIVDAKNAGADGFLEKPFDQITLAREVERLSISDT